MNKIKHFYLTNNKSIMDGGYGYHKKYWNVHGFFNIMNNDNEIKKIDKKMKSML